MNKQLMTIVLETAAFLELAKDEVDPDVATEQMEGITSTLGQLAPEEKKTLAQFADDYANEEERAKGDPERVDFFRAFPEHFGLLE